jgi:hypothetical protein
MMTSPGLGKGCLGGANTLAARLFCVITVSMKRQSVITRKKKKRGPPPTGKGKLIGVRILPPLLKELDAWIAGHGKPMSRPEAIRYALEEWLSRYRM